MSPVDVEEGNRWKKTRRQVQRVETGLVLLTSKHCTDVALRVTESRRPTRRNTHLPDISTTSTTQSASSKAAPDHSLPVEKRGSLQQRAGEARSSVPGGEDAMWNKTRRQVQRIETDLTGPLLLLSNYCTDIVAELMDTYRQAQSNMYLANMPSDPKCRCASG